MDFSSFKALHSSAYDARGTHITGELVRDIENLYTEDAEEFWRSSQFFVKVWHCDYNIRERLSAIPDDMFKCLTSLCIDLGFHWVPVGGLTPVYNPQQEMLLKDLLRRGNENLVIKVLWYTTLLLQVDSGRAINTGRPKIGEFYFCANNGEEIDDFKDWYNSWKEGHVQLFTRISWRDGWPDWHWEWEYEEQKYEQWEKIFATDNVSPSEIDFRYDFIYKRIDIEDGLSWTGTEEQTSQPDGNLLVTVWQGIWKSIWG
ncbi:hypothetical protein BT63DRAFT_454848 [Microthyrium microscopicum]|uniref:Uncharacterized protein n=1 Tax=Microthyrium microscopicum TaxID=703497 RepID=A0A6A6UFS8_9PEZI|nr:hypothetical protein BT63DRAFT_454848 [Microthyrium microscopicum]